MPKISIITTTYKHEKFIASTIESLLSQSFMDWELLIGDDNSPDSTYQIIQEYAKKDSILEVAQQINGLKIENLVSIKKVISEGYQKGVFKREAPAEAVVMVVIGGTSYLILNEKTYLELWGIKTHEEFKQRIHSEYYPYLIDSLKAILLYDEK